MSDAKEATRLPLTVDPQCQRCGGKGTVMHTHGWGPGAVRHRAVCSCVGPSEERGDGGWLGGAMRMDTEQGDRMLQLVKAFRDDPTPDKARELMRLTAQQLVETVDKMPDPLVLRMALNACEGLDPW